MMFPAFDFEDQIPTKLPSVFTLKCPLKMVSAKGKAVNWKNPKLARVIKRKRYVPSVGTELIGFPWREQTIGTKEYAKTVGIAVFKKTKGNLLSFMIEYLKNVPIARDMKISESKTPKKSYPIPN